MVLANVNNGWTWTSLFILGLGWYWFQLFMRGINFWDAFPQDYDRFEQFRKETCDPTFSTIKCTNENCGTSDRRSSCIPEMFDVGCMSTFLRIMMKDWLRSTEWIVFAKSTEPDWHGQNLFIASRSFFILWGCVADYRYLQGQDRNECSVKGKGSRYIEIRYNETIPACHEWQEYHPDSNSTDHHRRLAGGAGEHLVEDVTCGTFWCPRYHAVEIWSINHLWYSNCATVSDCIIFVASPMLAFCICLPNAEPWLGLKP